MSDTEKGEQGNVRFDMRGSSLIELTGAECGGAIINDEGGVIQLCVIISYHWKQFVNCDKYLDDVIIKWLGRGDR